MTTRSAGARFKYVGPHIDDLHDGRVLEPGATYELDAAAQADPHNRQRIDAGVLVELPDRKKERA